MPKVQRHQTTIKNNKKKIGNRKAKRMQWQMVELLTSVISNNCNNKHQPIFFVPTNTGSYRVLGANREHLYRNEEGGWRI